MASHGRCRDSFITIMKRMPLKIRAVLIICALVVIVEIISGVIDMNFNYEAIKSKRMVGIGKHRERKEVSGVLVNASFTDDDEDWNISEPPTELADGEMGGLTGGGGEATGSGGEATTTARTSQFTTHKMTSLSSSNRTNSDGGSNKLNSGRNSDTEVAGGVEKRFSNNSQSSESGGQRSGPVVVVET